jgi:hypothetical protein
MDFGLGMGYVDKKGNPPKQNEHFLREFLELLEKYEVR